MNLVYTYSQQGVNLQMEVINPATRQIVWSRVYPSYTEDQRTGDLIEEYTLVDFGVMSNLTDTEGLQSHLKNIGAISDSDNIEFSKNLKLSLYETGGKIKKDKMKKSNEKSKSKGKKLFTEVQPSARFVLMKMFSEKLYRTGFNKQSPKFEEMKAGVKDAIDKGYLTAKEDDKKYILTGTNKLRSLYYSGSDKKKFSQGGKPLGSTGVFAKGGSTSDESARIYVADLAAYNEGNLVGEWLDLDDYDNAEELQEAVDELMEKWSKEQGVEREEYAIHDHEYLPDSMVGEYMSISDLEKYYEAKKVADDIGIPLIVVLTWAEDNGYDVDQAPDAYQTTVKDMEDYAYELVDEGVITDLSRYLFLTETDRRIIAGEEADARLDGMDEDEMIKEAELEDELSELESRRDEEEEKEEDDKDPDFDFDDEKEELVSKAREKLHDDYYDEVFEKLDNPVDYFVDELGAYTEEDLAKSNFMSVDYKALARDLEQDFNTVEHDGEVYVFNSNFAKGGSVKKKEGRR